MTKIIYRGHTTCLMSQLRPTPTPEIMRLILDTSDSGQIGCKWVRQESDLYRRRVTDTHWYTSQPNRLLGGYIVILGEFEL